MSDKFTASAELYKALHMSGITLLESAGRLSEITARDDLAHHSVKEMLSDIRKAIHKVETMAEAFEAAMLELREH